MTDPKLGKGADLPENFRRIWAANDEIIDWAELKVSETPHLGEHLNLIQMSMSGVEFLRTSGVVSRRHTAIAGLFLRTFDALTHGVYFKSTDNLNS